MGSMDTWRLNDGTSIDLLSLNQRVVYEGLMEGVPTREMNREIIEDMLTEHPGAHLVEPAETPIELKRPYPFGTPASLPLLACAARFRGPGRTDAVLYQTHLTVLWFQDTWAFPVAADVVAAIQRLSWMDIAKETEV